MNKKELKKAFEICERNGWSVYDSGEGVELSQYSPAGEDYNFYVYKKNFIEEVCEYADNFDPDEHAAMWHGQNKGEPQSLRELLQDTDDIKKMLQDLAGELTGTPKEKAPEVFEYIETLTAKNKYNYTIKQLNINHTAHTFEVLTGGECRIAKKNTTRKAINEKITQLQKAGYTLTRGRE